ncbi:hypothetical protein B0T21DRAFT_354792 [Apiosordaria backusii]|uniref:Uncharacterized protein n=1 Tax=Apiosordaria backusii TaxID=314023 RepID=A0AA40EYC5_9PEZI|nr:hypothetical protein B0T21DRAFT_354792 [Apiosordaria backusii]
MVCSSTSNKLTGRTLQRFWARQLTSTGRRLLSTPRYQCEQKRLQATGVASYQVITSHHTRAARFGTT